MLTNRRCPFWSSAHLTLRAALFATGGTPPSNTHKANTDAYKQGLGTEKRASANVRETKVDVSNHKHSKLMMVPSKVAKEIR